MINEEVKLFYQKNGYIMIKGVLNEASETYCARLDKAIEVMASSIDTTKEEYLSAVCRWDMPCEIVDELNNEIGAIIEPLVRGLLERDVEVVRASVIRKSTEAKKGTHGHQDSGYWSINHSDRYNITTWIALENINASNGALRIVPGSHLLGTQAQGDFLSKDFIDPAEVWGDSAKTLNMSAGDMVLFSPDLWHASHGCEKYQTRIAFIIRWRGITPVLSLGNEAKIFEATSKQFGMQTSGSLLMKTLKLLVENAGLSSSDSLEDLILLVLSNNLTNGLPEPSKANIALSKLRILNLAKIHGGKDLGIGIWEDIRDFIVEPSSVFAML